VRELQKMPEGVEIKAKITKGGKGAKKRKADGSVGSPYKRPEQDLISRMTIRLVQADKAIVRRRKKRSRRSAHLVRKPLHESRSSRKRSRVRSRR
jgi:hypothetical protein